MRGGTGPDLSVFLLCSLWWRGRALKQSVLALLAVVVGRFDGLGVAVSAALTSDLSSRSASELVQVARDLESVRCRLAAVEIRVDVELEARAVAGEFARSTTADLLVSELRLTPAEAKARVQRAKDLGPRCSPLGEVLPPLLPTVCEALTKGLISTGHVGVITRCADDLPDTATFQTLHLVEQTLVRFAATEHPGQLRKTAALLLARLDQDGDEPRFRDDEATRGVTLYRKPDGTGRISGRLSVEGMAVWDAILDSLSAPVPSEDGERDPRSAAARRHDALLEAGQRLLRSDTLPHAGVPVAVLVRTTLDELREGHGIAFTPRGEQWPVTAMIEQGLSDAQIIPILTDRDGSLLDVGRTRRLATREQRHALALRDGGCSFPGCDRPPGWTEAHHVIDWRHGGETETGNLTLICRFHHREFASRGWQVHMNHGLPEWTPPTWIDPQQTPRRNTAHHTHEHRFDAALASHAA